MGGIVCAIRGGPGSETTVDAGIALAKRTDLLVYFLYVVNLDFLKHTNRSRVHAITDEMDDLGDFFVSAAKEKAETQGVSAESVIRHGNVRQSIVELCHELNADYLILGSPAEETEENFFTHQQQEEFARHIAEETGVKVIIPGKSQL